MPRRKAAEKRKRTPDSKYNDYVISQFVGSLMKKGKKSIAEEILYSAWISVKGNPARRDWNFFIKR